MTPRFRLLSADPAWRFGDKLRMSKVARGAEANYATMSVAEICALPVGSLMDDDAVCVLWRPSALAREALTVMDAWGFRQTGEIVWYKVRESGKPHFGMGRITRAAKEVAYIGVRGSPYKHLKYRNVRDVFVSPPLRHSAKPDVIQETFARMFPGPALELWARRDLPGWTCIGNECPSTFGRCLQDVLAGMVPAASAAA
jgi:N6-adenosine-specific RNA methylase IME4